MSKNSKRQRKLEEITGSSSTKKRKRDNDTNVVNNTEASSAVKKISQNDLEILKQFDLDMTFGPCTGISRIDRYQRALRHDLNPPTRVLELIKLYPNDLQVIHCIWRNYTL